MYDGYDHNEDPYQFGIHGWEVESDGLTRMRGPTLGIVLSVQAADSDDNLLYRMLQGEKASSSKCSHLEADVLLIYDGKDIFQQVSHVVILQDKCSQYGPGEREPSDWTEDVPNGCKDDELKAFYADGGRTAVQNLSGDWVIVDFLGNILQLPMITRWFPNPSNNRDAATKKMGKRFLLRRNNSEISISDNGDFHITHRDGQYIQLRNKKITIKHREGQMIHLDADGKIFITDKTGNSILLDEDGVSLNTGTSLLEVGDQNLSAVVDGGDVDLLASGISMVASTINASSGSGGDPLCLKTVSDDLVKFFSAYLYLLDLLGQLPAPVGPILKAGLEGYKAAMSLTVLAAQLGLNSSDGSALPDSERLVTDRHLTKVLAGE